MHIVFSGSRNYFFLHFNLDIFSSLYATDMYREYMPCIGNPAYSFRPILLKLYRYFAAFLWFHMRNLSLAGYNCSGGASCMACSFITDDCVCYCEIKDEEDTMKLQRDIDRLGSWARKWGMRFQPVKCHMMQLTRKRIKKTHASYTLAGTDLENVESIKYLGVTITSDLRWNAHVSNVCTKANRTLGFLRRNLYSCPQEIKEAAYKGLVCPVLDYGSSVWEPPQV